MSSRMTPENQGMPAVYACLSSFGSTNNIKKWRGNSPKVLPRNMLRAFLKKNISKRSWMAV